MSNTTEETRQEVRDIVYNFFADECEVDLDQLQDDTLIIEDLEGDSLMFLELLELIKAKYDLVVALQAIGKHMLKNQADTIGKVIDLTLKVIENDGLLEEQAAA